MLRTRASDLGWNRHVFLRYPNEEFEELLSKPMGLSGVYLLGCANEIVYVGQSWHIKGRSIESLGRYYHRVPDTSLPWAIGLAPCPPEEMVERESTAIRAYAPKFNTSIPSVPKSQGRMPEVIGVAAVFHDQKGHCRAFDTENLERQLEIAQSNPLPPWKKRRVRKKVAVPKPRHKKNMEAEASRLEDFVCFKRSFAVPRRRPLPYKINLCEEGDVITRDGIIIGTWRLDENSQISFLPYDASDLLFVDMSLRRLCEQISDWYETGTGDVIF